METGIDPESPRAGASAAVDAGARQNTVGRTCARCGRVLAAGKREGAKFCDDRCRRAWHHARTRGAAIAVAALEQIRDLALRALDTISRADGAGLGEAHGDHPVLPDPVDGVRW